MSTIKIVFSSEDAAGTLVAKKLVEKFGFGNAGGAETSLENKNVVVYRHENGLAELIEVSERLSRECEYLAGIPKIFSCELMLFASRHRAESGTPCFTCHAPGNFSGKNGFGGNPFELGLTSARASACLLRWLKKKQLEGGLGEYGVFREATHHGPTSLPWPSVFCELGSTEKEWMDEKAAEKLGEAIMFVAEKFRELGEKGREENDFTKGRVSVGFGGTHYCSKFSQREFTGENCFSHVASKHVLDEIDEQTILQAMEKTIEKNNGEQVEALLDWKGTSARQREKLLKFFGEIGVEFQRI